MPATYAHYSFGCECLGSLSEDLAKVCKIHRDLYDFGVHGPDFMFYYKPLSKNEVNRFGSNMHHRTGRDVFTGFIDRYQKRISEPDCTKEEKDAMLAYLLGFLSHFAFDSTAHAYINQATDIYHITHNALESEYEAFLMKRVGIKPLKMKRATLIDPSEAAAKVIAVFFDFPLEQVYGSIQGQQQVMKLLYSPTEIKKKLLRKVIEVFKIGGDFGDLFLEKEGTATGDITNKEVDALRLKAGEKYPVLAQNFMAVLEGKGSLNELFDFDFEGILQEQ